MDEINKLVLLPFFLSFKRKIDEQHKFFFSSNTFSLCKSVLTSTSLGINLFFFIFLRMTLKQYKACRTIYNLFLLLELLSCKQFIKYHTMKNISFGQKYYKFVKSMKIQVKNHFSWDTFQILQTEKVKNYQQRRAIKNTGSAVMSTMAVKNQRNFEGGVYRRGKS